MQVAADAGAILGAQAIKRGNTTGTQVEDTAREGTAANSFTHGVEGTVVTVNHPPVGGFYAGESAVVEVIISQDQRNFFMPLFNFWSTVVSARGVAGYTADGGGCIYALNASSPQAFHVHDSVVNVECGIVVNSNDPGSAMYCESGANVNAMTIDITGSYAASDCTMNPYSPQTSVPPTPDPLAYMVPPDLTGVSCDHTNYNLNSAGSDTLSPGTYCGGIHIESASTATMLPGTYIMSLLSG